MSDANGNSMLPQQMEDIKVPPDVNCAVQILKVIDKLYSTIDSLSTQIREFDQQPMDTLPFLNEQQDKESSSSLLEWARAAVELAREKYSTGTESKPIIHVAQVILKIAGTLRTLATWPASRLQILGSEKAYRRAKRTGSDMPKFGNIIYSTEAIQRAPVKHRGKIARILANKCALAARHDFFNIDNTGQFGRSLREVVDGKIIQLEEADKLYELKKLRVTASETGEETKSAGNVDGQVMGQLYMSAERLLEDDTKPEKDNISQGEI
ncbi:hypothetical protein F5Y03DRAFT_397128 [Xylaria venustula]|nr:hypothetical protein F5Y03DRAFT_397128 [Xylaria venustula]